VSEREIGGVGDRPYDSLLIEGGQLDQVVVGDALYGVAGFAPGAEAAGDYEDFES